MTNISDTAEGPEDCYYHVALFTFFEFFFLHTLKYFQIRVSIHFFIKMHDYSVFRLFKSFLVVC